MSTVSRGEISSTFAYSNLTYASCRHTVPSCRHTVCTDEPETQIFENCDMHTSQTFCILTCIEITIHTPCPRLAAGPQQMGPSQTQAEGEDGDEGGRFGRVHIY